MVTAGIEGGDFYKILLRESRGKGFRLSRYAQYLQEVQGAAVMDARSVFDFLTSDSGKLPSDRRLALDLRLVQHYLRASSWSLRWVSGPQQLSDSLTKEEGDTRYLFWVLRNSKYQLLRDTTLESKVKKELTAAEKELREKETPEERQRRRNKQKGDNHRRRDRQVERVLRLGGAPVYGLKDPPKEWEARLTEHFRRQTLSAEWIGGEGVIYSLRKGIRGLLKTLAPARA